MTLAADLCLDAGARASLAGCSPGWLTAPGPRHWAHLETVAARTAGGGARPGMVVLAGQPDLPCCPPA